MLAHPSKVIPLFAKGKGVFFLGDWGAGVGTEHFGLFGVDVLASLFASGTCSAVLGLQLG